VSEARCQHPGCGCAADDRGYCSVYCANAVEQAPEGLPDTAGSACACGHARCEEGQRPPRSAPEPPVSIGPKGGTPGRRG